MACTKLNGAQIADATITDTQISTTAAIATSKLFAGAEFLQRNGTVAMTGNLNANSNKVVALADPTTGTDAATKAYVDALLQGLATKEPVRSVSTTNLVLSGTQTVTGVALVAGDRILVTGQTAGAENGPYLVAVGAWTRTTDMDTSAKAKSGSSFRVTEGTEAESGWVLATDGVITLGTTALVFSKYTGGAGIIGGAGVVLTGNTLDVVSANAGLLVNADNVALTVDPTGANLEVAAGGLRIKRGTTGQILVGNASGDPTLVAMSGDATINNTGAVTIGTGAVTTAKMASIGAANILVGAVTTGNPTAVAMSGDATIATTGAVTIATGAVTTAKMASIGAGNILVGAVTTGNPTAVAMSGDATISTTGAVTIGTGAVSATKLASDAVTTIKILDGNVTLPKLGSIGAAKIIVGAVTTGNPTAVDMTGDATISNTGVVTVASTVAKPATNYVNAETPTGTIDGTNATFTLASSPVAANTGGRALTIFLNGLALLEGAGEDYTVSGATITFVATCKPQTGDKLRASYWK